MTKRQMKLKKANNTGGENTLTTLLIVFVVLKLTDNINWDWWWVLTPLWIPVLIAAVIVLISSIYLGIKESLNNNSDV